MPNIINIFLTAPCQIIQRNQSFYSRKTVYLYKLSAVISSKMLGCSKMEREKILSKFSDR